FLGEVRCADAPSALRSYTVTLVGWNDSEEPEPFVIGSSGPASCAAVLGFRDVISVGGIYTAEIDGYELPAERLRPSGGNASGSRRMLDVASGEAVTPRWTSRCGTTREDGVLAVNSRRTFIRPCDPLSDVSPGPTRLAVNASRILAPEAPHTACSLAASLDVEFSGGSLPPLVGVSCEAADVLFDVAPGSRIDLYAHADLASGPAGVECYAVPRAGETVYPTCQALTTKGLVAIDLSELADLCPPGASYDLYDASAPESPLNSLPLACGPTAKVGPFDAGDRSFAVTFRDGATGSPLPGSATCTATVIAGRTATATCFAN
ncbi:MAG: hypothetical protein KC731_28140, partial [Myxococcales bacterium]|nr:hypothetical protein [Myxococcales bacterium]